MKRLAVLIFALLIGALLLVPLVSAQTGGGYDLTWSSVDGGGGQSSGNGYTLNGTIGQSDAGTLIGGEYTLSGGLWSGIAPEYRVFLPLVLRVQ
ncbi:MAG: hypothetical protein HY870_08060 [Chloroflexi bacterium]|nr:hypothetical protein [Chloroflexota bacterium]